MLWEVLVNEFKTAFLNSETIIEEALFFTCVIASLPGLILDIGGGSAFYFFSVQRVIAITLLLGYNIPYELLGYLRIDRRFIRIVMASFIIFCLSWNMCVSTLADTCSLIRDCFMGSLQREESVKENSFWSVVNGINEITDGNKENYYIYVCESASIWDKYPYNQDSPLFFYPALTGIVCIGELYFDDGILYLNNGKEKTEGYKYIPESKDEKMTEEDAFQKAKKDGKKAVIYIHDDTFSVKQIDEV